MAPRSSALAIVISVIILAAASPSPSVLKAPPPGGLQVAGALLAIVFALAAAVLGYRIIRGGRGL